MMSETSRFRRILVPLDGSDRSQASLAYVRALADRETEVILLQVVPEPTLLTEFAGTAVARLEDARMKRVAEAIAYLEDTSGTLADITPKTRTKVAVALPPEEILREARDEAVDLIVMATHGRGFFGRVAMGSVADRVARAATMPVLMVNPNDKDRPGTGTAAPVGRIVVPFDGSDFSRQAFPLATRLARRLDVPVQILRVIDLRGEWMFDEEDDEELVAPMREELTDLLRLEADELRRTGIRAGFDVLVGPPARRIQEAVEPRDLIVMTSHGAGGIRRWLLGSVAEHLIRSGVAPVMIVPIGQRARLTTAVERAHEEANAAPA